ncbi:Uracil-DNA glycosylase [Burkholderiales bacterium 8X]|nr:Uracil-DNA glycosylase [Burkholderiales bacterium 8X]
MNETSLNLDARQRAMLEEMGVKVWWPATARTSNGPAVEAPGDASPNPDRVASEPPGRANAPSASQATSNQESDISATVRLAPNASRRAPSVSPSPTGPASSPAPAAPAHGAAVLVQAPIRLDLGQGPAQGGWLIVADMPPELDGRHGEPFAGDAGKLLHNMLRALRLHDGGTPVHLMRTHRGVASGQPGTPAPFARRFAEEASALRPRVILAMGPLAGQELIQSAEPLGKLRGRVARLGMPAVGLDPATPVVVTYHPAYLLRSPADKARAWCDLCLAAEQASGMPAAAGPPASAT